MSKIFQKIVLSLATFAISLSAFSIEAVSKKCDLSSTKSQFTEGIKDILVNVYTLDGQALDRSKIRVQYLRGEAFCDLYDSTEDRCYPDRVIQTNVFRVRFISPKGTELAFGYWAETKMDLYVGIRSVSEYGEEGQVVAKTCQGYSFQKAMYASRLPTIYNPATGVEAQISNQLEKVSPDGLLFKFRR